MKIKYNHKIINIHDKSQYLELGWRITLINARKVLMSSSQIFFIKTVPATHEGFVSVFIDH